MRLISRPWVTFWALTLLVGAPGCSFRQASSTGAGSSGDGSGEAAQRWTDDTELPFDHGVLKKRLANGLTYYIEPNEEPQNRTVLRLVVAAGSTSEDDDQRGLAHVVEHMGFNGSEHFEGNGIPEYLESLGMKFGAHLNAYTAFDQTVYMLQVPTEDEAAMKQAFVVLRDWARGLSFVAEEIEKERGVVLEEWRSRRGVGGRISDALVPLRFHGARYADRLPIGTEESLKTFAPEALRRFYDDWYRPDLMAVMAVGDFDPDFVEAQILEQFGDLVGPQEPRDQVKPTLPGHEETLALVFTDPELPFSQVLLGNSFPKQEGSTFGDYRRVTLGRLASSILNERLAALAEQADPPFHRASAGSGRVTWSSVGDRAVASVPEGGVLAGLEVLMTEVERARRHGFTQAELDRACAKKLESMDKAYKERDKSASSSAAAELVRNFLTGETVPGIEVEWEIMRVVLDRVRLGDVNTFAAKFLGPTSRYVAALLPEKESLQAPTEEQLLDVLAAVQEKDIPPPAPEEQVAPLIAEPPVPGRIVKEEHVEAFDATRWTLDNGMQVLVKTTDFKADEVRFAGSFWGGHSLASDDDYVAASTASRLRSQSGLGDHSRIQLKKLLSGKRSSINLQVSELSQRISGSSSFADLELTFQQLWVLATRPRFDEKVFARTKKSRTEQLANRLARPRTHMQDAFARLLWQDHPRTRPWDVETLEGMDLAKSRAFFSERMANWNGALLVIVGSVDLTTLRPLVERYVASLPSAGVASTYHDLQKRPATGVHEETVHAGLEPKAAVRIRFSGEYESSPETRHSLRTMVEVLKVLMREELREDKGGTYGVGVSATTVENPVNYYGINLRWGCDPVRVDEMVEAADAVIDRILAGPLDARYAATVREKQRRTIETDKRSNSFWKDAMLSNHKRGEEPEALQRYWSLTEEVTPKYIHQAAQAYIDKGRYVKVVLLPEEAATAGKSETE